MATETSLWGRPETACCRAEYGLGYSRAGLLGVERVLLEQVGEALVEGDVDVGEPAVGRDRGRQVRAEGLDRLGLGGGEPAGVLGELGLEVLGQRVGHRRDAVDLAEGAGGGGHGRGVGGVGELLALGHREHDGGGGGVLAGEPVLEQVVGRLRARVGDAEVVRDRLLVDGAEVAAERHDDEPHEGDPAVVARHPAARGARARPAGTRRAGWGGAATDRARARGGGSRAEPTGVGGDGTGIGHTHERPTDGRALRTMVRRAHGRGRCHGRETVVSSGPGTLRR